MNDIGKSCLSLLRMLMRLECDSLIPARNDLSGFSE